MYIGTMAHGSLGCGWSSPNDQAGQSLDDVLRLLADRTRRKLLRHLLEAEPAPVAVDDLVAALAGTDAFDATDRRALAIDLHHVHLPRLADEGVVDWDPERGTVRYRPIDPIEALLADLPADAE